MNRIEKAKHRTGTVALFAANIKKGGMAKYIPVTICSDVPTLGKDVSDMCKIVDALPSADTMMEVLGASLSLCKTMRANASFITSSMNADQLKTFRENVDKLEKANGLFRKFVRKFCGEAKQAPENS